MEPIQTLLELEALRLLKARYFRLLDTQQWAAWAELFEPDMTAELPNDQPGQMTRGRDTFVSSVAKTLAGVTTVHHGHTPELELLTPTTAKGVWAMEDRLTWPDSGDGAARAMHGWGHYTETYRKSDAGWRIATLMLTRLRVETR